jgi:hypothetical protein
VVDGFTQVPTPWDDLSVDCTALVTRGNGGPQMPATCDPLHRGFALALRERVADSLSALAEGPLSEAEIAAKLEMWTAQIEPVVAEANALYPSELSPLVWHDQVQQLRTTLRRLRDEALAHRAQ